MREQLVGYAIRAVASRPRQQFAAHSGLTAQELDAHLAELEPLMQLRPLAELVDSERFLYLDTVTILMSGRMSSRKLIGLLEPAAISPGDEESAEALRHLRAAREVAFQLLLLGADINETLRYGNRMYDEFAAAIAAPTHSERKAALSAIEERVLQDAIFTDRGSGLVATYLFSSREEVQAIPGRVLTSLLMPALSAVETAYTRTEAYAAVTKAAFGAQASLQRQEDPLKALAALKSGETPLGIDPFDGQPLRVRVDDRGLVIYSIGPNGVDNGGFKHDERDDCDDLRVILTLAP